MKSLIAGRSSRPATPTKVTVSPYCSCTAATAGASARHVGHHGAQNHKTVSVPSRALKSI